MQRSLFSELQVSPEIKSAVEKIGLERCSSLQTERIPLIKERKETRISHKYDKENFVANY